MSYIRYVKLQNNKYWKRWLINPLLVSVFKLYWFISILTCSSSKFYLHLPHFIKSFVEFLSMYFLNRFSIFLLTATKPVFCWKLIKWKFSYLPCRLSIKWEEKISCTNVAMIFFIIICKEFQGILTENI